ncbi:alpha/beta fold hydrolase [Rhizobiales bacterium]|uniref:RBBP9/YdeN family alpha/beta hydrolase n=1 Tax=Hongsoonwoonella zoysiae TaxID=2821844 RepID=UPI00155F95F0|nr:alpha/beta fold hydrolase [Hongsoonwoonella zoysiae]NRG17699.1 alpha/beta fold hydrolase [Hongsoonwoonella zoysiae]
MGSTVFLFHGTEGHPDIHWLGWLNRTLSAEGHAVIAPQFPSPPNEVPTKVDEWHDVLSEYADQIDENTVFIGHSLGGLFALRVLEKLAHKVKVAAIVASPLGVKPVNDVERAEASSGYIFDWDTISANCDNFFVFYGEDDPYVAIGNGTLAAEKLRTDLISVPNAGHFNTDSGYTSFSLLWETIRPVLSG